MIVLRKDLHHLFDQRRFTFAVRDSTDGRGSELIIHVLDPQSSTELIDLYHNRQMQPLTDISLRLLFARFA